MERPPKKYDPKIPMRKADDWTRRVFIQRTGVLLGTFGFSLLERVEFMEKLSKKVFGSSLAYAQASDPTYLLSFRFRAGYPLQNLFPSERDTGLQIANRNYHSKFSLTLPRPVTGGRSLYLPPQAGTLLDPFVNRISVLTSLANGTGHTNVFYDSAMSGTADYFNAHASKMKRVAASILPQGIVYGSRNDVDYSTLGPLSAEFTPIYARVTGDVRGLFQQFQLTAADGSALNTSVTDAVFSVVDSDLNQPILDKIAGRPGAAAIVSGIETFKTLLSQNLATQLDQNTEVNPRVALLRDTGNPNIPLDPPGSRFSTSTSIFEEIAVAGLLFKLGITNQVGININTGDWHTEHALPEADAADEPGNGTVQGEHAAFWAQLLANMLAEFGNPTGGYTTAAGPPIGDRLIVTFTSEFSRTLMDNNDNGDGRNRTIVIIGPDGRCNPGTFGNHDDALMPIPVDPATGAANPGGSQLAQAYGYNTILRALGVDMKSDAGVGGIPTWVTAIRA